MLQEIQTVNFAHVNCYLVKTKAGFFLIDTGIPSKRSGIEKALENAGCKPGDLKLILITHGDFDHAGNAAYFRDKYGTQIAMNRDESEVVERGDMLLSRKDRHFFIRILFKIILKILLPFMRLSKFEKFKPDLYVGDGYDLSGCGFEGRVLHIPGHSKGSIGILTVNGDLFCGDLFVHKDKPRFNSLIDDLAAANNSVTKLSSLKVNTVYPGHGKPFDWALLMKAYHCNDFYISG